MFIYNTKQQNGGRYLDFWVLALKMANKFPHVTAWSPTSLSSSFLIFPASWFQFSYFLTGFYSYLKLVPLHVNPSLFPSYYLPLLYLIEDEVLLLSPACQGPGGCVTNERSIAFIQTWSCPHWWSAEMTGKVSSSVGAGNRVLGYFRSWNTKNHEHGSSCVEG